MALFKHLTGNEALRVADELDKIADSVMHTPLFNPLTDTAATMRKYGPIIATDGALDIRRAAGDNPVLLAVASKAMSLILGQIEP